MTARRVAILCMNPWDAEGPFQPFSYAAHRIEAAVKAKHPEVEVAVMDATDWSADRWESEVEALQPDIVAASTYVWSLPTFVEVCRRLKANAPERWVVFGGPSARPSMMSQPPYADSTEVVDALVLKEGEQTFNEVVEAWGRPREALLEISGLAVSADGRWQLTAPRTWIEDLNLLPSPFQMGLAPAGVTGHLETFRGCPMSCTFCQWGDLGSGGKIFTEEYLAAELQAMKDSQCTGVYHVDAGLNLNARAFRNLAAAEAQVGFIRDTELVCEIYPTLLQQEHLDMLASTRATVGLGLQSLDDAVLEGIQRPFKAGQFDRVVRSLAEVAQTSIELIMGLPGDTPEGFLRTYERVRRLPVSFRVYHALVLPDALLTRAPDHFAMDFDPITLEMRSCLGWSARDIDRMAAFLTEQAATHGGMHSQVWPRPAEQADLTFHVGKPVGTSLWIFPHDEHEDYHRRRPRRLAQNIGMARR